MLDDQVYKNVITYTPFDGFVDRLPDGGHVQARIESVAFVGSLGWE